MGDGRWGCSAAIGGTRRDARSCPGAKQTFFFDIELGVICYQGDVWFCVCILSGELKMTKQTP